MRQLVAIALAAAALIAVIAPATAPAQTNRAFAAVPARFDVVLVYRDGTTKTASFERGARPKGLFKNVVHADITVTRTDGSTRARDVDRGRITSVSEGSLTLRRPDGATVTLTVTPKTLVRQKGTRVRLDALQTGERGLFHSASGKLGLVRLAPAGGSR